MLDPDSDKCHNDRQESITEHTEGGRRKLSVGNVGCGIEFRCHDEFLHIAPSQVRDLQPAKAKRELERLPKKFWIARKVLGKKEIYAIFGLSERDITRRRPLTYDRFHEEWLCYP